MLSIPPRVAILLPPLCIGNQSSNQASAMKSEGSDSISNHNGDTLAFYQKRPTLFPRNVASRSTLRTLKREEEDEEKKPPKEYRFDFGKHRGRTIDYVVHCDHSYIGWLILERVGRNRPDLRNALAPFYACLTPKSTSQQAWIQQETTPPFNQTPPPNSKLTYAEACDAFTKGLLISGRDVWKYFLKSGRQLEVEGLPKAFMEKMEGHYYWLYHVFEHIKTNYSEKAAVWALTEWEHELMDREIIEHDYGSLITILNQLFP